MSPKQNPHWGTTLDEFLADEGMSQTAKAEAQKRVAAWLGTTPRARSRMRREIVETMRGLHKVGAVSDSELEETTRRMLGKDAPR